MRVFLVYKDFSYWLGYSSVGLRVAAETTAQALTNAGVTAEAQPVKDNVCLFDRIRHAIALNKAPTCVIIMAPWISPLDLSALVKYFPQINFAVQIHTNIGALHGDRRGIGNIRNYLDLTFDCPNFTVAANTRRMADWLNRTFDAKVVLLPNMYPFAERAPVRKDGSISIGAFGAVRPEKNFITATAAALALQRELDVQVNYHMTVGGETSGEKIMATITQMTDGVPGFTLIRHGWLNWKNFCALVARMDLLLQPSYTESFCITTADGIANGVPSVVSPAIMWAPEDWKADVDDVSAIVNKGMHLLTDCGVVRRAGWAALRKHNAGGLEDWLRYLDREHQHAR